MVKEIVKDPLFLAQKSLPATKKDLQTAKNLEDTLKANAYRCVGLAANMIGVRKNIITFFADNVCCTMLNPVIIQKQKPYTVSESCLSLEGERAVTRYEIITVKYQNKDFKELTAEFSGFTAEIIQHEIDHCNGIVI